MMKLRVLCILLFSTLLLCNQVFAEDKKQNTLNKSQAAQQAQKVAKGRVLKVEQNDKKYRVKVLQKSGRVVSVNVDKKSGKVSK